MSQGFWLASSREHRDGWLPTAASPSNGEEAEVEILPLRFRMLQSGLPYHIRVHYVLLRVFLAVLRVSGRLYRPFVILTRKVHVQSRQMVCLEHRRMEKLRKCKYVYMCRFLGLDVRCGSQHQSDWGDYARVWIVRLRCKLICMCVFFLQVYKLLGDQHHCCFKCCFQKKPWLGEISTTAMTKQGLLLCTESLQSSHGISSNMRANPLSSFARTSLV